MANSWFSFRAVKDDEVEVSIYDVIGLWGISAQDFANELKRHGGKKVSLRINSPGGSVTEGSAIFNALKRHRGGVTVHVDGMAASMGSYIMLAGDTVRMAENAYVMIHNPSGVAEGGAKDMRKAAEVLDKMKANLVNAYVAKTGKDAEEIEELMNDETWFTAEEALDFGLVDEITERVDAAACVSAASRSLLDQYVRPPAAAIALVDTPRASMVNTPEPAAAPIEKGIFDKLAALFQDGAKIENLTSQITNLTAERDTARAEVVNLRQQVNDITIERDTAKAELVKLNEEMPGKIATAASAKAVEITASVGVPPVDAEKPARAATAQPKQLTSAEFNALGPVEKMDFSRNGGRVVDSAK